MVLHFSRLLLHTEALHIVQRTERKRLIGLYSTQSTPTSSTVIRDRILIAPDQHSYSYIIFIYHINLLFISKLSPRNPRISRSAHIRFVNNAERSPCQVECVGTGTRAQRAAERRSPDRSRNSTPKPR